MKIRQQIKKKEENNMIGFGKFGKRNLGINSLSDNCLAIIDPTQGGFYDNVLNYTSENDDIIDAIFKEPELLKKVFSFLLCDNFVEGPLPKFI